MLLFCESLVTSDLLFYYSIHTKLRNVHGKCTFSRHGRIEASFTLLIWLDENVHGKCTFFF